RGRAKVGQRAAGAANVAWPVGRCPGPSPFRRGGSLYGSSETRGPMVLLGSTGRASSAGMSLRDEIADQPRVVRRLLEEGWPEARTLGRALAGVEHITLVARGSSANAATYRKDLVEGIARGVPALPAP